MGSLRIVPILLLLAGPALAQKYGLGRAPSSAELAQGITISPTGVGLPPGHGTAAEGAVLFTQKLCVVCHGPEVASAARASGRERAIGERKALAVPDTLSAVMLGVSNHLQGDGWGDVRRAAGM